MWLSFLHDNVFHWLQPAVPPISDGLKNRTNAHRVESHWCDVENSAAVRFDNWSKQSLWKREHVHARWERGAVAVIKAGIRLLKSDSEAGRTLSHALQGRQP